MKIALIGYGKMGKMIEQIARDRGHEIVSVIDIDNQEEFESEAFASADVPIEFTAPTAAYGNYLKAYLPKASTENERSMVVIRTPHGVEVMARQIAGAMARRIVTYAKEGEECFIDDHMGFI